MANQYEVINEIVTTNFEGELVTIPAGTILNAEPITKINKLNGTFDTEFNGEELEITIDEEYVKEL